jgi:cytochrome c oxidase assembly factor CtaG
VVLRSLPVVLLAAGALALHAWGVARLRARGGAWPARREMAVVAGVLVVALGAVGPWGSRFSGHVIEHLLLGLVGPALVAAGRPVTLALRSSSRPARRRLRRALASPVASVLTHPAVAVGTAVLAPWVVWLSPVDDWQRDSGVAHAVVHAHLVASGLLFGVVVLGLDHTRWRRCHGARLLAAAVALPLHALLGLVILSADTPFLNPTMPVRAGLADQRLGAALLWVVGDAIATAAILVVGLQWAAWERRDTVLPHAFVDDVRIEPAPVTH